MLRRRQPPAPERGLHSSGFVVKFSSLSRLN